jgi:glycosyl transferase, family 25
MTINEYFDKVVFINLARRTDRLEHALKEFKKHGIEAERFEAIDGRVLGEAEGKNLGHHGCTTSHLRVLEFIIENGWERTLVLEDDIQFRYANTQELFSKFIEEVPEDWFMIYLSGHYGDVPKRWAAPHVIEFDYMKTTSAYGIKLSSAIEMAPKISVGGGGIDEFYSHFSHVKPCYIFEPRLAFQCESFSDIEGFVTAGEGCMTEDNHVEQLPDPHGWFGRHKNHGYYGPLHIP